MRVKITLALLLFSAFIAGYGFGGANASLNAEKALPKFQDNPALLLPHTLIGKDLYNHYLFILIWVPFGIVAAAGAWTWHCRKNKH